MLAVHQPVQDRSRRTLAALLDATESLLEERRFEQISVAEIILKAGVSTGSFYARFSGKDALLPALYARYHADLPERLAHVREMLEREQPSFVETCLRVVREFSGSFQRRLNLMRAITIYARTRPEQIRPLLGERASLHRQMVDLFLPFRAEIIHADVEDAIQRGLLLVATVIREAVLFPDAPFAAVTRQPLDHLERMLAGILHNYLTTGSELP